MSVLAIDPGMKNMAMWKGKSEDDPEQRFWKFDLTVGFKHPLYESASRLMETDAYGLLEGHTRVVIESQAPSNIQARIVACTIYGYCRAKGIDVVFSGAKLKANAMKRLAEKHGLELLEKPSTKKAHATNKKNAVAVVAKALPKEIYEKLLDCAEGATARKKKLDDLSDAYLLGVGAIHDDIFLS